MTDTIRDLLISLSSHMAYMQGQLEAGLVLHDPEHYYWYRESVLLRQKVTDALADEPAVPEGREPASVTGQPSDGELLETLDKATAAFPPRHPEAEGLNAVEYPLALELRKARAVLARWGHQPAPPADGEVAELVRLLGSMAAEAELADQVHDASVLDRAADLLHRLSPPQPVPVSERLPGPEDCDAEGRCWWGRNESDDWSADWTLATHEAVAEFCEFCPRTVWLPATALPLPGQEVEG